jgi:lysozyme
MSKTSALGVRMIMQLEGSKAVIYNDAGGLPTIGVGHLLTRDELSSGAIQLSGGRVIDIKQALSYESIHDILVDDLGVAEDAVSRVIKQPLNQHQFDALVSWTFNVGQGALERSTLAQLLNDGDFDSVPAQLRRWDKAGGRVLRALQTRRETEVSMWLGQYTDSSVVVAEPIDKPVTYITDNHGETMPIYYEPVKPTATSNVQAEVEKSSIYKLVARFVPEGYGTYTTAAIAIIVGALDIASDNFGMPHLPFIDYSISGLSWVIGGLGMAFLRRAQQ